MPTPIAGANRPHAPAIICFCPAKYFHTYDKTSRHLDVAIDQGSTASYEVRSLAAHALLDRECLLFDA